MPLQTATGDYLTSKEAAAYLDMAYSTFTNRRTALGDRFLRGHSDLIAGRVLFRADDVRRLAAERAGR